MEAVMFKDMITLDNEDQTDCEQDKLAQNLIVCPRSLEVNSVKEIMSVSHKCEGNPLAHHGSSLEPFYNY